jgi:hypothetical protein
MLRLTQAPQDPSLGPEYPSTRRHHCRPHCQCRHCCSRPRSAFHCGRPPFPTRGCHHSHPTLSTGNCQPSHPPPIFNRQRGHPLSPTLRCQRGHPHLASPAVAQLTSTSTSASRRSPAHSIQTPLSPRPPPVFLPHFQPRFRAHIISRRTSTFSSLPLFIHTLSSTLWT